MLGESADTVGNVGGESIEAVTEADEVPVVAVAPTIIHEDDTFIAVKNDAAVEAPSAYPLALQTNIFERLVASPHTMLSYAYMALAMIGVLALVLFVFLEFHIQKPANIILSILLLLIMGFLLILSDTEVVLAEVQALSTSVLRS